MIPTPSIAALTVLLAGNLLVSACTPALPASAHAAAPRPSACEDSRYVQLRTAEPDNLSEREWTRLRQLDELCVTERRATIAGAAPVGEAARPGAIHGAPWLWMTAMMVFGGLVWLIMGG